MAERTPRELNTREKTRRRWQPSATLPDPHPEPGYQFRWVRTAMMGQSDVTNVGASLRDGYEFVKAADHPELMVDPIAEGRFAGGVEVGGLILMKIPNEIVQEMEAYYNGQTQQQMVAVDNDINRLNDPRMPVFKERKSSVSFGNG